jgi:hypoxanthine phosphoribosyltransferase
MSLSLENISNNPTWEEVRKYSVALIDQMDVDKFRPNFLMPVSEGGLFIASFMTLELPGVPVIGLSISGGRHRSMGFNRHIERNIFSINNFLIVDDSLKSDDVLTSAINLVEKNRGRSRLACIVTGSNQRVTPDYFLETTDQEVIFPWESLKT